MTRTLPNWMPTNAWVRLAIVPVLVFVALATDRNYLCDFWHHLARGRAITEHGELVNRDLFTYTVAGQPFQDVNWLSQLCYYSLFQVGGLPLVQVLNAALLAATLGLLVWFCWRRCGSLPAAAGVGVLTFFGVWEVLTIRPQTFSLFLFVLLYVILDRSRERPRLLLLPPVLLALWANLHGAFPAGLLLLGCYVGAAVVQEWWEGKGVLRASYGRQLLLCLGASVLATVVNPYGVGIYQYVGLTSNRAAERRIDEWVPPSLRQLIGIAFFASLVLLACLWLVSYVRTRRRPGVREVFLLACFVALAAGSVRMVAWWLLVIAPMLATLIAGLLPQEKSDAEPDHPSKDAAVVFGLLALLVVFCLPGLADYNPLLRFTRSGPRTEEDLEAVHARLEAPRGTGRVFSSLEWGEYLTWTASPTYKVFMDGRIEIYPDLVWEQYSDVTCGKENWQKILDGYGVDYLILDGPYHAQTGLLARVHESPNWEKVYQSRDAMLFVRRPNTALAKAAGPRE